MDVTLSIIVPALRVDDDLRRCIASIRAARMDRGTYEVIVVLPDTQMAPARDAFTDIKLVPERRRGIYGAMNDGVRVSRGRYLYFLGQDDMVLEGFGRELVPMLQKSSAAAVFFDVYWGCEGIYRDRPSRWDVLRRNVCHQGVVYSTEVFRELGPYVRSMRIRADHFLNIKLLWTDHLRANVHYVPRPLAWFAGQGLSTTSPQDPVFDRLLPAIVGRYVGAWAQRVLVAKRLLGRRRR